MTSPGSMVSPVVTDVVPVLTRVSIAYDDSGRELQTLRVREGVGIGLRQRSATPTGRGSGAVRRLLAARGLLDQARARYDLHQ